VDALVLSDSGGFRLIGTQSWAHWLEWWTLKWTQNSDFSALRSSQTALPERHDAGEGIACRLVDLGTFQRRSACASPAPSPTHLYRKSPFPQVPSIPVLL